MTQKNRKHNEGETPPPEPMQVEIFSVEAIMPPIPPRPGQTPSERLDAICLEICQKYPYAGWDNPDNRLVNRTTQAERKEMLKLSENAGVDIEGLGSIIRHSHGIYKDVLMQLKALQPRK